MYSAYTVYNTKGKELLVSAPSEEHALTVAQACIHVRNEDRAKIYESTKTIATWDDAVYLRLALEDEKLGVLYRNGGSPIWRVKPMPIWVLGNAAPRQQRPIVKRRPMYNASSQPKATPTPKPVQTTLALEGHRLYPMLAKFKGWCRVCKRSIAVGDPIRAGKIDGESYACHERCPDVAVPKDSIQRICARKGCRRPFFVLKSTPVVQRPKYCCAACEMDQGL